VLNPLALILITSQALTALDTPYAAYRQVGGEPDAAPRTQRVAVFDLQAPDGSTDYDPVSQEVNKAWCERFAREWDERQDWAIWWCEPINELD